MNLTNNYTLFKTLNNLFKPNKLIIVFSNIK